MTKITLLFAVLCFPLSLFAGSNFGDAKVKSISYKADGQLIVEFYELTQDTHMMSSFPKGYTKLRFDYLNWPPGSRHSTWWYKALPWTEKKRDFNKDNFESCLNQMILAYKNQTTFKFGQSGGGEFQKASDVADELIIPNLIFRKTDDGKENLCLIDLG